MTSHPFFHTVELSATRRIQGLVLGVVLFPLRLVLSALFFLLMWPVARLRLAGLSEAQRAEPVRGWRLWLLRPLVVLLSRAVFFCVGFLWIRVRGRQAGAAEAPVLTVAPHSSFLDILILTCTGLPTVVSRSENTRLPVIGALLEFNQAVLVSRTDSASRSKCVSEIRRRVCSRGHWPQMLMFPEGTTTNGRALIKFKPGAFLAGVPVQPVLLHYSTDPDTVRWTWRGSSWLTTLWHTMSQLYTTVTVEFLPVYCPTEQERTHPQLFAQNVQRVMARSLNVPATDYVMEGCFPVEKLKDLSLPVEPPAHETLSLLQQHGLSDAHLKVLLRDLIDSCPSREVTEVTADQLTTLLGLRDRGAALKICSLYSTGECVDLKQVLLSLTAAGGFISLSSLLHTAFTWYDSDGDGLLSELDLSRLMAALVGVPQHDVTLLFTTLTSRGRATEECLRDVLLEDEEYTKIFTSLSVVRNPKEPPVF